MLNKITIQLPKPSALWNSSFSDDFFRLIRSCTNIIYINNDKILLGNPNLNPLTEIVLNSKSSAVSFNDTSEEELEYKTKGLSFGFNINSLEVNNRNNAKFNIVKDSVGEYCEVFSDGTKYCQLTLNQLLSRFEGKFIELNHTGMNFASSEIAEKQYIQFKKKVADSSYLVKYPTGEEWPFIIPCSENEFSNGITDMEINRNPKFEMVYSDYHEVPVIQFDVQSSLSKEEAIELLPDPYGVSFEGLEDFTRTVFILTDINGIVLRFDIRFQNDGEKDFYPWMITDGGRVNETN